MAVATDAIGKTYPPTTLRGRAREDPRVRARRRRDRTRCTSTSTPPARPATATSSRRRCSPSSTAARRSRPALFDPEVGIDFARLVHGGQEFRWGPLVVAGDEITTTVTLKDDLGARADGLLRLRVGLDEPATARPSASGTWTNIVRGAAMKAGDELPELKVTPDRYLTVRYAGASGDFNPIHIDDEFAREVGLPGKILHGLWTMAQVARAADRGGGRARTPCGA